VISYSLVISVTVPFLTKFPLESDTETTARTTADLSLFLKFGSEASILALATFCDVDNVMLREYWFSPRFRERSGALMSTSLVAEGARTLSPALCLPTTVKDDDDSEGTRSDLDFATFVTGSTCLSLFDWYWGLAFGFS